MEPKITYNPSYYDLERSVRIKIKSILKQLSEQVEQNAKDLLQARYTKYLNSEENKKLKKWHEKCQEYLCCGRLPRNIYMAYGYAVEELTNLTLPSVSPPYSLSKQVLYGGSRCDYELSMKNGREETILAWIDITSKESEGHIWNKSTGHWQSAPCACEILYKRLDPGKIRNAPDRSIGKNIHVSSQRRQRTIRETAYNRYLMEHMRRVLDRLSPRNDPIPYEQVPNVFENEFRVELYDQDHIICHGLLALFVRNAPRGEGNNITKARRIINYHYCHHRYYSTHKAESYLEKSYRRNARNSNSFY